MMASTSSGFSGVLRSVLVLLPLSAWGASLDPLDQSATLNQDDLCQIPAIQPGDHAKCDNLSFVQDLFPDKEVHIPWIVSVQDARFETPRTFCGGVIVDAVWILTSAFCVNGYSPNDLKVIAGDSDLSDVSGWEQEAEVEEIIVHDAFNTFTQSHDVALLRIWPPLRPTWRVAAVPLNRNTKSSKFVGAVCRTHGWGMIETSGVMSSLLQEVNVTVIKNRDCKEKYPGLIHRTMFCAATKDISFPCSGNWGSPLVCNGTDLVGLASWGNKCGREDFPVVFVEVKTVIAWVQDNVEEFRRKICD